MAELIITEKPSSAKKLAQALADTAPVQKKNKQSSYYVLKHGGKPIIITSAVGHLYGLVEKEGNSWSYPVFDIVWQASYKTFKDLKYVKDYVDTISMLSKKADEFTIACDYDIEGEVIGLNVIRYACKQKDANRMKFSTLTKADLVESYEKRLPHLDWGQAFAGETRHKLDWFYGINLSRALTASVKAAGSFKIMSAGRVQGPALKILVDREKEIRAFEPIPFWLIGLWGEKKNTLIEAWHEKDKIFEKETAQEIFEKVKDEKTAGVNSVKRSERKQPPPYPFDLTSLQSESYNLFKITPKQTLAIAQSLYLAGVTSYPRTSSQQLDQKLGLKAIIKKLSAQPTYSELCNQLLKFGSLTPNNGKKTDPAHPAIYPTGIAPKALKDREIKIYDLIVKRFMATFAKAALRETMEVNFNVKDEIFVAKGTRTIEENWHVFYKPYVKLEEKKLPDLKEGEKINVDKIEKIEKETQPPKRYNQSSIIKELEKRNLGTKATRADILDRLFQRGYVDGVKITATQLGISTVELLEKFASAIVDEKLTARFEEQMEEIREGKKKEDAVLIEARKFLEKILAGFKKKEKVIGEEILGSMRETWDAQNFMGPCPLCDGKLMVKRGKFGRFVACGKYPDCKAIFNIPKTGSLKYIGELCDACKHPIIESGAGRGKKVLCINSKCPKKEQSTGNKYKEEGMTCPTCSEGKMILRKSFYGEFLGCDNYPKCKTLMNIKEGAVNVDKPVVKTGAEKKKKKAVKKKKTVRKKKTSKKK